MTNVIVFSSKGSRPAAHKMSGGDLDGDVFMAIWDKSILEHLKIENIKEPAIYKKYSPKYEGLPNGNYLPPLIKYYLKEDRLG